MNLKNYTDKFKRSDHTLLLTIGDTLYEARLSRSINIITKSKICLLLLIASQLTNDNRKLFNKLSINIKDHRLSINPLFLKLLNETKNINLNKPHKIIESYPDYILSYLHSDIQIVFYIKSTNISDINSAINIVKQISNFDNLFSKNSIDFMINNNIEKFSIFYTTSDDIINLDVIDLKFRFFTIFDYEKV